MATRKHYISAFAIRCGETPNQSALRSCSNLNCAATPHYLVEFSVIGLPAKATMHLCRECWKEIIDNMGIVPESIESSGEGS